jgi:hypothetical protein
MKLLVTGGRAYFDREFIWSTLDALHDKTPIALLIHGDATGVDTIAKRWAQSRGVEEKPYPIDRDKGENGYQRNERMFLYSQPNRVLAFPGGSGTHDMIRVARAYSIPVTRYR